MKNSNAVYISDDAFMALRALKDASSVPMGILASDCILRYLAPKLTKPKKRQPAIIYNAKP